MRCVLAAAETCVSHWNSKGVGNAKLGGGGRGHRAVGRVSRCSAAYSSSTQVIGISQRSIKLIAHTTAAALAPHNGNLSRNERARGEACNMNMYCPKLSYKIKKEILILDQKNKKIKIKFHVKNMFFFFSFCSCALCREIGKSRI